MRTNKINNYFTFVIISHICLCAAFRGFSWRFLLELFFMEAGFSICSAKEEISYSLNLKQKDELKCAFDILDEQGVGTIEVQDIVIVIRALGLHATPTDISKLIRRYDPQKTGTLDFRGFLTMVERIMFTNQNGAEYITFGDTQRIARQLNEDISDEELQELFNGADLNNDGVIDFNEFSTILKKSPLSRYHDTW
ncbi:Centrin-2 [Taenia crassiceps]|uniref:Centrin-2 n=1 Tax=Taenia crassiceps TaxID=6207 RepID=A0ABR4QRI9_9CEST